MSDNPLPVARKLEPMNFVSLFQRVAELRRDAFVKLCVADLILMSLAALPGLLLAMSFAELLQTNAALAILLQFVGSLVTLAVSFVLTTAWLRLLGSGEIASGIPFRFAASEKSAALASLIVLGSLLGVGVLGAAIFAGMTAIMPGLGAVVFLLGLAGALAGAYCLIRLMPLVGMSFFNQRVELAAAWTRGGEIFTTLFLATLVLVFASIVIGLFGEALKFGLSAVAGIQFVQPGQFPPAITGAGSVFAMIQYVLIGLLLRLMQYSMITYAAQSNADSEWWQEIRALEVRDANAD